MPALARRTIKSVAPVRRKNPQIAKLKERLAKAGKRARGRGGMVDKEKTVLTVAGAAAFAYAEKKGVAIPTVAGLDPALLIGCVAAFLGPRFLPGKNGQRAQAVGDGLLAFAAARAVQRGGVKVAGEGVGGVEIGADEDDLSRND
jgi:hypothetical protein